MTAMDYRQYDSALGRFNSMDVLSELFYDSTPYAFSLNIPTVFADPTGLCPECIKNTKNPTTGQSYIDSAGTTHVYNGTDWEGQIETVVVKSPEKPKEVSVAAKALDVATDFVPVVSSLKDIYNGVNEGSPLQVLAGFGFLAFDVATFGTSSLAKGGIKTLLREGTELTAKETFTSFRAFKRVNGTAGAGNAWHHIVEQNKDNIAKFGAESIHNLDNLVKIPHGKGSLHMKVTGHYNSIMPGTSMRVRDYVKTLGYDEQFEYGINKLIEFGWIPIK